MPLIEYVPKRFKPESMDLIDRAVEFVDAYADQGLVLTLRQLYYRFIAAALLPNIEQSYSRLGGLVNDARLAGLIDWNAIEDRGRNLIRRAHWDTPEEIIGACAGQYQIDKWSDQTYRCEVWVEKQALEAVVGQAAEAWDCPYFSCKGYTSQSEMWRAAQRFQEYRRAGQIPVIIHLGDHDPSGIDMTRDIADRLNEVFRVQVTVDRIALTWDQIREYDPPPNPAKVSDSRFASYQEKYGDESWELDALEPATLNELIQTSIQGYLDRKLWDARVATETRQRELLQQVADRWDDIVGTLGGKKAGAGTGALKRQVRKLETELAEKSKTLDETTDLLKRSLEALETFNKLFPGTKRRGSIADYIGDGPTTKKKPKKKRPR